MFANGQWASSRMECLGKYLPHFVGKMLTGHRCCCKPEKSGKAEPLPISRYLRVNRVYFLALAISVLFLASSALLIFYFSLLSWRDASGYIRTEAQQIKLAIEEHVSEEFATLMTAAVVAEDRDLLAEDRTLDNLVKGLRAYNSYVSVGFADVEKRAAWLDRFGRKHSVERLDEDFIDQALANKRAVSTARWDEASGMNVVFYAVPVHASGSSEVKGVFFAADPVHDLRTVINNSLYAGQGLAHIIDRSGNFIVKSKSPLTLAVGNNLFSVRDSVVSSGMKQRILASLEAGETGCQKTHFDRENRLIAYTPLNMNGWYVFYSVPEDRVSVGLKTAVIGAMAIIAIAVVLFASFILLIRHVNNRVRRTLEALAFVDPVTKGFNSNKFQLDAAEALRAAGGKGYAVCYSDIEGFRYVNDLFGREEGDRLLRYWSNFLREITREGEVFGRMGGGVFVILLKYTSKQEIERRFMSMVHRLAVYPETLTQGYKVELYGGVYLTESEDGQLSLSDMLDRALTAQKTVKAAKSGERLGFYSCEMREQKLWEAEVESKMETSLENQEFQIYMQPKIDIQHGDRIMGAEALVRWSLPEKGVIPPGRFIEIFERNGFIVKLDSFVFESACRYYRENVLEGTMPAHILSVNVSKRSLMQPDFSTTYARIKDSHGIPHGVMELEFTESLVFENHALLRSIVADCKRNGFLCSLDDFGAGYSSLNLLKSIHVDVLKLDRLFFQRGEDAERGHELVRNIVAMAKALGMKIVAEGIDMQDQVEQLREMGCDAVQGYVFAKPMPVESFGRFCETWGKGGSGTPLSDNQCRTGGPGIGSAAGK